ncbi:pentatricopeptide repeat-containing protein [Pyrus ussuriensis x Pyrus communis]|uniref:Pentatricopeptide repeat-containing protein n=1 Tax=Pyrus ussuriensis x Pyrus communis TaxID=2448454 RepID=A0A5N5GXV3_9ROSA|nr:pentatricopeptide repeat-containing protein [Pyrus ussuriensis x Pyrus communis]
MCLLLLDRMLRISLSNILVNSKPFILCVLYQISSKFFNAVQAEMVLTTIRSKQLQFHNCSVSRRRNSVSNPTPIPQIRASQAAASIFFAGPRVLASQVATPSRFAVFITVVDVGVLAFPDSSIAVIFLTHYWVHKDLVIWVSKKPSAVISAHDSRRR